MSNTKTETAITCRLTGYPMVQTVVTYQVYVVHSFDHDPVELVEDATAQDGQRLARHFRDNQGRLGVRLALETRTRTTVEYAGEYGELVADRIAAGEFDA